MDVVIFYTIENFEEEAHVPMGGKFCVSHKGSNNLGYFLS